jgi:cytochrome c-type biogenesis protein CcmH/NrfG
LRRALKIAPTDGRTWSLLSDFLLKTGDVQGALESAEKAAALAPTLHSSHLNLGLARWRTDDSLGALQAFENAIRRRPSDAWTMLYAVAILSELHRDDEALRYAERAVAAEPGNARAWAALGSTLVTTGDRDGAEAAFSRSVDLESGGMGSHSPPPPSDSVAPAASRPGD